MINKEIMQFLNDNNNIITTADAVKLGFSRSLLSVYAKKGLLVRERQGVYVYAEAVHDDMYTLMLRSKKIIFSHETALFLNGLSERTPFIHCVTVPSDCKLSKTISDECDIFYIKPEFHKLGEIVLETTFGNKVRCYNIERTICDIIRSRNRLDEDTVIGAIKSYAFSDKKDLNLLAKYADIFGVSKILKSYLEVLL